MGDRPNAESRSEFHEDLISEILLKLPLKALIRFKRVSKTWWKIITSHQFTSKHYYNSIAGSQSSNKIDFFAVLRNWSYRAFNNNIVTVMSFSSDQLQCRKNGENIRPCLDVKFKCRPVVAFPQVFYAGLGLYCIFDVETKRIALWNPCTREIKEMPKSPFDEKDGQVVDHYRYGFGHVEYKDGRFSYKIGLLSMKYDKVNDHSYYFTVEVYNSSTCVWKVLTYGRNKIGYKYSTMWPYVGVNASGKFHLLSADLRNDPYIMTFDYGSEIFGRMEVPVLPQIGRYYWDRSLITLFEDKFLCLVLFWRREEIDWFGFKPFEVAEELGDGGVLLEVWVMGDYGVDGSWYKECTAGPITGPLADRKKISSYSKSLGGIFLHEFRNPVLHFCKCSSSEVIHIDSDSYWPETMQILKRMESLVAIDGAPHGSHFIDLVD